MNPTVMLVIRSVAMLAAVAVPIFIGKVVAQRNDIPIIWLLLGFPAAAGWVEIFSLITGASRLSLYTNKGGAMVFAFAAVWVVYFLSLKAFKLQWWQSLQKRLPSEQKTVTGPLKTTDILPKKIEGTP